MGKTSRKKIGKSYRKVKKARRLRREHRHTARHSRP